MLGRDHRPAYPELEAADSDLDAPACNAGIATGLPLSFALQPIRSNPIGYQSVGHGLRPLLGQQNVSLRTAGTVCVPPHLNGRCRIGPRTLRHLGNYPACRRIELG